MFAMNDSAKSSFWAYSTDLLLHFTTLKSTWFFYILIMHLFLVWFPLLLKSLSRLYPPKLLVTDVANLFFIFHSLSLLLQCIPPLTVWQTFSLALEADVSTFRYTHKHMHTFLYDHSSSLKPHTPILLSQDLCNPLSFTHSSFYFSEVVDCRWECWGILSRHPDGGTQRANKLIHPGNDGRA